MDVRTLSRPATQLLKTTTRQTQTLLPLTTSRGHKTTARTKRALKIAPHDSFLPNRSQPFPAADHIIYNPPASEASPEHTPFIFLPANDPRREAIQRMRLSSPEALGSVAGASPENESDLPPAMRYPRRRAQYNLTEDDMAEMRRLRNEDPLRWSTNALSKKFNCSPIIVSIAAPAPAEHKKWLEEKAERRRERWGPIKTQAREDRGRRAEMLYRGEI